MDTTNSKKESLKDGYLNLLELLDMPDSIKTKFKDDEYVESENYKKFLWSMEESLFQNLDMNSNHTNMKILYKIKYDLQKTENIDNLYQNCYENNIDKVKELLKECDSSDDLNEAACLSILLEHFDLARYIIDAVDLLYYERLLHIMILLDNYSEDLFKHIVKKYDNYLYNIGDVFGYCLMYGKHKLAEFLFKNCDIDPYGSFEG